MFVATINKNLKSYLFAILGAEYILRWLPIGTHDWNKFLTPQELEKIAEKNNFAADQLVGSFNKSFGIRTCIIRPFNTFGPSQSLRAVIPPIITQLIKNKNKSAP